MTEKTEKITILAVQIHHESAHKQNNDIETPTHYPILVSPKANSSPRLVSRAGFASCSLREESNKNDGKMAITVLAIFGHFSLIIFKILKLDRNHRSCFRLSPEPQCKQLHKQFRCFSQSDEIAPIFGKDH